MTFDQLSNEEIVFINALIGDMVKEFTDAIEAKGISCIVDSEWGRIKIFKEFGEEELEALINNDKLKISKSITKKFLPLVELIREGDPDLVESISAMVQTSPDKDEDQTEDM